MKLITNAQRTKLLANGRAAQEARRSDRGIDPYPVVKLFTPDAQCVWLLTEIDPNNPDRAFGLDDIGHGCPELAYVRLQDLEGLRGHLGLAVERDRHFKADKPLSSYAEAARRAGRIVT